MLSSTPIHVRRLDPGDRRSVVDVFRGLSERSRTLRFHGPKPRLADSELEALVAVGCCGREAVAAVEIEAGRTIGTARFVRDGLAPVAEVAFEVVDEWQGQGIGRALVDELAVLARQEGIERFRAYVAPGNEAAFALLRRVGPVLSSRYEDGAFEVVVALR